MKKISTEIRCVVLEILLQMKSSFQPQVNFGQAHVTSLSHFNRLFFGFIFNFATSFHSIMVRENVDA